MPESPPWLPVKSPTRPFVATPAGGLPASGSDPSPGLVPSRRLASPTDLRASFIPHSLLGFLPEEPSLPAGEAGFGRTPSGLLFKALSPSAVVREGPRTFRTGTSREPSLPRFLEARNPPQVGPTPLRARFGVSLRRKDRRLLGLGSRGETPAFLRFPADRELVRLRGIDPSPPGCPGRPSGRRLRRPGPPLGGATGALPAAM